MKLGLVTKAWATCKRISNIQESCLLFLFFDYCLSFFRHGCTPSQYERGRFYSLSCFMRNKTMTHNRSLSAQKHFNNQNYTYILEDKSSFNSHFSKFIHRDWLDLSSASFEDFVSFTSKHPDYIVKPKNLKQGKGIRKDIVKANLLQTYNDYKKEDVLLEELIDQHPRMFFNNGSVNTVRVMSILDVHGNCHILKTILRAGVGNCVVDNYAAGGCIYAVDKESGIVESRGKSKKGIENITHPNSDIIMLGYRLPNWDKLQTMVSAAHMSIPQCRYIGWDVAITQDGVELVEGNHKPDYELLEFLGETQWWSTIKKYW